MELSAEGQLASVDGQKFFEPSACYKQSVPFPVVLVPFISRLQPLVSYFCSFFFQCLQDLNAFKTLSISYRRENREETIKCMGARNLL